MDLESLETQTLLKKRTPMRQSLALSRAATGLQTATLVEWYGTQAGSVVDVLILQSNYPADIVKTVVEADNANWFFTNVYGPLAASQAAGAAPIIKAWLAGEELPATFP